MHIESADIITRAQGYGNQHDELNLTIPGFIGDTYQFLYEKKEDINIHGKPQQWYFGRHFELPLVRGFLQTNNTVGYGGWTFPVDLVSGETETLRGPWSSRPACYMAMGFPHYIEVSINRTTAGYGLLLEDAMKMVPQSHIIIGKDDGEFYYIIKEMK